MAIKWIPVHSFENRHCCEQTCQTRQHCQFRQRRWPSEGWNDRGGSQEVSLRSIAQLITAIISPVSSRDKGLLAQALIIKHKVVCLLMLWEDVEIKAEGLI